MILQVSGFPNVVGCVDGTYINIQTPAHKIKNTYVNRHHMTALTLQGICDARKRFLDVFTGVPSKIHDSRVFSMSFINERIQHICGDNYHLLGDSAYSLSPFLLTPFRDYGNLTAEQRYYNEKFCATRVLIENTFQLLKGRFRQLIRLDFHNVEKASRFILSCCVLHNMCIDNEDFWEDQDGEPHQMGAPAEAEPDQRPLMLRRLGEQKRNFIMMSLYNRRNR